MFKRKDFTNDWSYALATNFVIWLIIFGGLFLIFVSSWVYFYFIRKNNSQNLTGETATKNIFEQLKTYDIFIIKKLLFSKSNSYNAKKNIYRIRPWIFSSSSFWALSCAAQQAYIASERFASSTKTFSIISWSPWLIRITTSLVVALTIYFTYHFNGKALSGNAAIVSISVAVAIFMMGFTISSAIKIILLKTNTLPLIKKFGLSNQELKWISCTFWISTLIAFPLAILDLLTLPLKQILKK